MVSWSYGSWGMETSKQCNSFWLRLWSSVWEQKYIHEYCTSRWSHKLSSGCARSFFKGVGCLQQIEWVMRALWCRKTVCLPRGALLLLEVEVSPFGIRTWSGSRPDDMSFLWSLFDVQLTPELLDQRLFLKGHSKQHTPDLCSVFRRCGSQHRGTLKNWPTAKTHETFSVLDPLDRWHCFKTQAIKGPDSLPTSSPRTGHIGLGRAPWTSETGIKYFKFSHLIELEAWSSFLLVKLQSDFDYVRVLRV